MGMHTVIEQVLRMTLVRTLSNRRIQVVKGESVLF
jgi:hypothetical protein